MEIPKNEFLTDVYLKKLHLAQLLRFIYMFKKKKSFIINKNQFKTLYYYYLKKITLNFKIFQFAYLYFLISYTLVRWDLIKIMLGCLKLI